MKKLFTSIVLALLLTFSFNISLNAETNTDGKLVDENGQVVEKSTRSEIMPISEDTNKEQDAKKENISAPTNPFFSKPSLVVLAFIIVSGAYFLLTRKNTFNNKEKGILRKSLLVDMDKEDNNNKK